MKTVSRHMRQGQSWVTTLICAFAFWLHVTAWNANAATVAGENSTDGTFVTANSWVYTPITISGIPTYAVISSILVEWDVDSNYASDVDWYVDKYGASGLEWKSSTYTDMTKTGDDWLDGYTDSSHQSKTLSSIPAAAKVNGTWYFNIADTWNDSDPNLNKGRIDWWKITITYSVPPGAPGTPDLAAADDTGYSNSDNITYQTTGLTFTWTAATGAERYYYGWDTATPSSAYTASLSADTNAPAGNGNHTFYVRGWNSLSGYGPASSLTVYIDLNRPSITNLDLRNSDDSGQSSTDNLTKNTNVRFTWTGNANGGSGIRQYNYGWSSTSMPTPTTNPYADVSPPSANGTYTFYVTAEALSGLWAYYPDFTDQETVTWDTIPPAAPTPSAPSGDIGTLTPTIIWPGNGSWKYQAKVQYYYAFFWRDHTTPFFGGINGSARRRQALRLLFQQVNCPGKPNTGPWYGRATARTIGAIGPLAQSSVRISCRHRARRTWPLPMTRDTAILTTSRAKPPA